MAMHDQEDNAARRKAKKVSDAQQSKLDLATQGLMKDEAGRALVWWLLDVGGVGIQPFSRDPYATAFNCGELNVGQQILAQVIRAAPAAYIQLLNERNQNERSDDDNADEPSSDTGSSAIASGTELHYPDPGKPSTSFDPSGDGDSRARGGDD